MGGRSQEEEEDTNTEEKKDDDDQAFIWTEAYRQEQYNKNQKGESGHVATSSTNILERRFASYHWFISLAISVENYAAICIGCLPGISAAAKFKMAATSVIGLYFL